MATTGFGGELRVAGRVPALVSAAFLLGPAAKFGFGAEALVVLIAVLSILLEAFPRAVIAWIEQPRSKLA